MHILNIKNTFKFKRAKCLILFSSSYWVKRLGITLAWSPTVRDLVCGRNVDRIRIEASLLKCKHMLPHQIHWLQKNVADTYGMFRVFYLFCSLMLVICYH